MLFVLTKVRINTRLHVRIEVKNVKFIFIVGSVNCRVCCENIRSLRDNESHKNSIFYFFFYTRITQIYSIITI